MARGDDAYEELRHLDGTVVRVSVPELTEDVDGWPLGVELVDQGHGTLYLPPLPDEDDDA